MNRTVRVIALLLLALALTACVPLPPATPPLQNTPAAETPVATGTATPSTPAAGNPLAGTRWVLASLNGAGPVSSNSPTLTFTADQMSGSGGCNSFGGEYTLVGDRLQPAMLASTEMACLQEGVMDQEQAYYQALSAGGQFRIDGDRLEILGEGGQVVLAFTRAAE